MAGRKLTNAEIEIRVIECYNRRYESQPPMRQEEWVELCHELYGDKSEQQYCQYWDKAKKRYEEGWKARMENLLGPATDELFRLLADENPKIRQRAIDQIMKYTGNDITKQEITGTIETIKVGFASDGS